MSKQPNPAYEPPLTDPREDGVKHWDQLRNELMITRDMLRAMTAENEAKSRRIDDMNADLKREKDISLRARNEVIALRTSLQNVGRMLMAILKEGNLAGRSDDPYQPPVVPVQRDVDLKEMEDLIHGMQGLPAGSRPVAPPTVLSGKVPDFLVNADDNGVMSKVTKFEPQR